MVYVYGVGFHGWDRLNKARQIIAETRENRTCHAEGVSLQEMIALIVEAVENREMDGEIGMQAKSV